MHARFLCGQVPHPPASTAGGLHGREDDAGDAVEAEGPERVVEPRPEGEAEAEVRAGCLVLLRAVQTGLPGVAGSGGQWRAWKVQWQPVAGSGRQWRAVAGMEHAWSR